MGEKAKGMGLEEHTEVAEVQPGRFKARDGRLHEFDACLWCTQAAPPSWLKTSSKGLPLGAVPHHHCRHSSCSAPCNGRRPMDALPLLDEEKWQIESQLVADNTASMLQMTLTSKSAVSPGCASAVHARVGQRQRSFASPYKELQ